MMTVSEMTQLQDIHVRSMRVDDISAASALIRAAYTPYDGNNPDYMAQLEDVSTRFATATENLVATDSQGKVCAAVTLCSYGNRWSDIALPGELEMRMLGVDPRIQGHGVGRTVLHTIQDYAVTHGYIAVVLSSREDMHAAHRLYEHCGFVVVPDRFWEPMPGLTVRCYRWTTG